MKAHEQAVVWTGVSGSLELLDHTVTLVSNLETAKLSSKVLPPVTSLPYREAGQPCPNVPPCVFLICASFVV